MLGHPLGITAALAAIPPPVGITPPAASPLPVAISLPATISPPAATGLIDIDGTGALLRLAAAVVVCTALAALIRARAQLGNGRDEVIAAARATVQLGVVGVIIAAVLSSGWLTATFIALMVAVASLTAAQRLRLRPRGWLFAPVALGALPTFGILLGLGVLPTEPIAMIPVAGILIGNAMTATTLCGRRALDALSTRYGEVEAALSLGFLPRTAAMRVARDDAALALVPGLDQTRTVGLVTLPGAFVGTLLGGATPLQAAALQLIVLVALLLVQSVATVVMLELVVGRRVTPVAEPPALTG